MVYQKDKKIDHSNKHVLFLKACKAKWQYMRDVMLQFKKGGQTFETDMLMGGWRLLQHERRKEKERKSRNKMLFVL